MEWEFAKFNWLDYALISLVALSALLGLKKGLVSEVLSLITWVVAILASLLWAQDFSRAFLLPYFENKIFSLIASFLILSIGILIIGAILNFILAHMLITSDGSRTLDALLGACFGVLRGIIVVLFILLLIALTAEKNQKWIKSSQINTHSKPIVTWMQTYLPQEPEKTLQQSNQILDSTKKEINRALAPYHLPQSEKNS